MEEKSSKKSLDKKDESDTDHAAIIPESVSDKIYNSIVRIHIGNIVGTGFFIKLKIKNENINCLITCYHIINENNVSNCDAFDIYYGKKIEEKKQTLSLDDNLRFIKCFKKPIDATVIEIIKNDKIPENKFLFPDMNFKNGLDFYLNKNVCLAGYPTNINFFEERHISSGKIKEILNNIEFVHSVDARYGSSGGPICLIDNQCVIGIHNSGIDKKKINFGTFFGHILDELENVKLSDSFVEINPFKILNINYEKFDEVKEKRKYFDYKELFECNNITLLAYFILYNSYKYEQNGEIFKVKKDHFYYAIMNDLPKLKLFLKNNKLLLYDMDEASRNLLHLSIIAKNHEITEYLLQEGLLLNSVCTYLDIKETRENHNFIQIIYDELKKKNLVENIYDIIENNKIIGKRIIRKKELYMNKNINKNISNYIKIYHGIKFTSIEPIMEVGLKKPGRERMRRKLIFNDFDDWINAIFVSPSIFYASETAGTVINEGVEFFILIEGRIKKDSYTSHESTFSKYKFKKGEPILLDFRVNDCPMSVDGKNENVFVESVLFVKKNFLDFHHFYEIYDYDYFNKLFNK